MSELPQILDMKPKEARRAWLRWMADNHDFDPGSRLYRQVEFIRLSIETWILNQGGEPAAESWARKSLEREFATFAESWPEGRG